MRSIIGVVLLCLVGFAIEGVCQDELPPEWLFDDEEDIINWGSPNNLEPLVIDDVKDGAGETRSVVMTVSTGGDPYVFPDGNWEGFIPDIAPFDGGEYDTIYIGVRVNQTNSWQIYYMTDEDGQYTERQRQNFEVAATGDFEDLEFVMETGGWQDEMIFGFRLDPGTATGIEAEIDYLSLRGLPEGATKAVEYSGKLAITWGAIKR